MRPWLTWVVIRAGVFVGLDHALIHDLWTSLAFWCAFSLIDLVVQSERAAKRAELAGRLAIAENQVRRLEIERVMFRGPS